MTTTELNELIITKLGVKPGAIYADFAVNAVRFMWQAKAYRVTTNLLVEKVDSACLVSDSDTHQLEKLLRGEQWDGTGLPPVGTECEFYKHDPHVIQAYQKGKIQYFSDCTVVIKTDKPGEIIGHPINFDFRPLRTERDKAIDQIAIYVNNTAAENLYDAIVAGKIDGLGKVG